MLEGFWDEYRAYRDSGNKERIHVAVPSAGQMELYYSMSSVRAAFRPDVPSFEDPQVWEKAVLDMAAKCKFSTDFRENSYVLTNWEGVYYARLRFAEFLFTPERFEEDPPLLEELVALYRPGALPGD